MPDTVRQRSSDLFVCGPNLRMIGAEERDHSILMPAFVETFLLETDPERPDVPVKVPDDQSRYGGRIEPAAEVTADRYIGPQPDFHRIQ